MKIKMDWSKLLLVGGLAMLLVSYPTILVELIVRPAWLLWGFFLFLLALVLMVGSCVVHLYKYETDT